MAYLTIPRARGASKYPVRRIFAFSQATIDIITVLCRKELSQFPITFFRNNYLIRTHDYLSNCNSMFV